VPDSTKQQSDSDFTPKINKNAGFNLPALCGFEWIEPNRLKNKNNLKQWFEAEIPIDTANKDSKT